MRFFVYIGFGANIPECAEIAFKFGIHGYENPIQSK